MTSPYSYLVAASQRSGSTLLVKSLEATGVAGTPEEFFHFFPETSLSPQAVDWFDEGTDQEVLDLLPPSKVGTPDTRSAEEWRDWVREAGKTQNGTWGGKLMWNQTPLVLRRTADLPDRSGTDLQSAIADTVGDVRYIRVTRDDRVSQAVSFWRAVQTQVWSGVTPPEKDEKAQYSAQGIAQLVRNLADQDAGWDTFFEENGITPYVVRFEDLAADLETTLSGVFDYLGIDAEVPSAPLRRQGNSRSEDWAERYREDAEKLRLPV